MTTTITTKFANEDEMQAFANVLAPCLLSGCTVFLSGELGIGKTTFIRMLLRKLGFTGKVKSPTYTIVEPYNINHLNVFHFDLYRLNSADELLNIGIDEYFHAENICLIEWPEKGIPFLPLADLHCHFSMKNDERQLLLTAESERGEMVLTAFNQSI